MSSYDWAHQFCLSCDKQTDGAAYCSESCRLADDEKTPSSTSSGASSPSPSQESHPWTASQRQSTGSRFYLSPAYDFSNAQPYGSTPLSQGFLSRVGEPNGSTASYLSTSSSHSSLASLKSHTSSTRHETAHLSEKARRELRAYASSFESVRLQRRRSY